MSENVKPTNTMTIELNKYEALVQDSTNLKGRLDSAIKLATQYEAILDEKKTEIEELKKAKEDKSLVIEKKMTKHDTWRGNSVWEVDSVEYRNFDSVRSEIKKELEKEFKGATVELEELKKKQQDTINDIQYEADRKVKRYRKDYDEQSERNQAEYKKSIKELEDKCKELKEKMTKIVEGKLDEQLEAARKELIEGLENRIKELEAPKTKDNFIVSWLFNILKSTSKNFLNTVSQLESKAFLRGLKSGAADAKFLRDSLLELKSGRPCFISNYGWINV